MTPALAALKEKIKQALQAELERHMVPAVAKVVAERVSINIWPLVEQADAGTRAQALEEAIAAVKTEKARWHAEHDSHHGFNMAIETLARLQSSAAPPTKKCPTCDSPSPELHPAIQYEGEVQPCRDSWHFNAREPVGFKRDPEAQFLSPAPLPAVDRARLVERLEKHANALELLVDSDPVTPPKELLTYGDEIALLRDAALALRGAEGTPPHELSNDIRVLKNPNPAGYAEKRYNDGLEVAAKLVDASVRSEATREGCSKYERPDGVLGGPCLNCGRSQPEHVT